MPLIAVIAALGAATTWAAMILLAHKPATLFGPFALTRLQLISAALVLVLLVSFQGGWASVAWTYWLSFVVASVIGVVVGNVAMFACLRRGGPRLSRADQAQLRQHPTRSPFPGLGQPAESLQALSRPGANSLA